MYTIGRVHMGQVTEARPSSHPASPTDNETPGNETAAAPWPDHVHYIHTHKENMLLWKLACEYA